jgi:large subunit ribosomal protein L19|tara:strand:+ start:85 stop:687 length:603 start_codon:yes stop_codon:yes gene_type:complete
MLVALRTRFVRSSSAHFLSTTPLSSYHSTAIYHSSSAAPLPSAAETSITTQQSKPKKWKKSTKRAQHLMNQLDEEQVAKSKVGREKWPDFKPGDAIQVRYKVNKSRARVQQMRGIVLARKNRGMGSSFLLHNIIAGSPFEIRFPLYSPLIEDIQMIQPSFIHKGAKRMKRAKLYYLRDELPSKITVKDTVEVMSMKDKTN